METSCQPGIFSRVPREVCEQHIFCLLPAYSLVACCLVDKYLRNICSRLLLIAQKKAQPQYQRGAVVTIILKSLFEAGVSIEFMDWFQKHLHYPVFLVTTTTATEAKQDL